MTENFSLKVLVIAVLIYGFLLYEINDCFEILVIIAQVSLDIH